MDIIDKIKDAKITDEEKKFIWIYLFNSNTFSTMEERKSIIMAAPKDEIKNLIKTSKDKENGYFTAVVSNPPYQSQPKKSDKNNTSITNIFHIFQEVASIVSDYTSMIYPGGRWIQQSGKGVKSFGIEMLKSKNLISIDYYDYEKTKRDVFPNVTIKDGVSIVFKSSSFDNKGKIIFNKNIIDSPDSGILPLDLNLIPLISKIIEFKKIKDRTKSRGLFGIESDFVEKNPDKVVEINNPCTLTTDKINLLTNDISGSAGRASWYLINKNEIPSGHEYIDKWKVVTGSGIQGNENKLNFEIIPHFSAFGRTRVMLSSFDSESEAINAKKYFESKFCKIMFIASIPGRLSGLGVFVPDLEDYTDSNPYIDWSQPLDPQLYKIFNLTQEEINIIEDK